MKKRILVIEDVPPVVKYLATLLDRAGFAVDTAETVQEGLSQAGSSEYHLVLLDLSLPDGSGSEVVRGLKQKKGTPPVLLVTGASQGDPRVAECLQLGAIGCVRKTSSVKSLLAAIQNAVGP